MNAATIYRRAFARIPTLTKEEANLLYGHSSDPRVDGIIARYEPCLRLMHKAAAVERCDWGVSSEGVFRQEYEHHDRVGSLSSAATQRSYYAFKAGRYRDGVNDLVAAMAVGRHVGGDGTIPGKQVEYAINESVMYQASWVLTDMPAEVAHEFLQGLNALRPSGSFSDVLRNKKQWALRYLHDAASTPEGIARFTRELEAQMHWQADFRTRCVTEWRDDARREKSIVNLESLYDEMIRIVEGSAHDRWKGANRYWKRQRSIGGIADAFAPVVGFCELEPIARSRLAMLKAAVAVRAGGVEQLQAHNDPFGDGPFEYQPTARGFKLRSKLMWGDRPFELVVEPPPPEDDEDEE